MFYEEPIRLTINDSVVNPVYRPYFTCPVRHLHLYGGAGSGKSVAVAQMVIFRCFLTPGERILCVRKVYRTCRRSQFALLVDVLTDWGLIGHVNVLRGEMEIIFPNGSRIMFAGMDDPEKIKSIAGITSIWIEEATELMEVDFNQLNLRLRGGTPSYKQLICSYNPIYDTHWIRQRFHLDPIDECEVVHTTYKDNRFLDQEYITELERLSELDEEFYHIYTLGLWATPTDTIIRKWKVVPGLPTTNIVARAFGLDFGSASPSALVEVVWRTPSTKLSAELTSEPGIPSLSKNVEGSMPEPVEGGGLYCHQHFYRTQMSNLDIIKGLQEAGVSRTALIAADASEPDRIEEISRAGFNIHPANKNVRYGLDYLNRFTIHVTAESSDVQKELPTYKWRKNKDGVVLDEPVKFNDHTIDATRYAAITGAEYFGIYKPPIPRSAKERHIKRKRKRKNTLKGYLE